jgi:hypothetical protein
MQCCGIFDFEINYKVFFLLICREFFFALPLDLHFLKPHSHNRSDSIVIFSGDNFYGF